MATLVKNSPKKGRMAKTPERHQSHSQINIAVAYVLELGSLRIDSKKNKNKYIQFPLAIESGYSSFGISV